MVINQQDAHRHKLNSDSLEAACYFRWLTLFYPAHPAENAQILGGCDPAIKLTWYDLAIEYRKPCI